MHGDFVLLSRVAEEREWSAGVAESQKTQKKCAFLYSWVSPVVATTGQTYKTKRVNVEIKKGERDSKKRRAQASRWTFLGCDGF